MEIIEDKHIIFNSLDDLVNKYESPDSPYKLKDVEPGFIEGMSKGIVAFKIDITKIEAKAKLSQNHPVERQELVIKQLEKASNQENLQVASLMWKNPPRWLWCQAPSR
jgi:transcriptional regulator